MSDESCDQLDKSQGVPERTHDSLLVTLGTVGGPNPAPFPVSGKAGGSQTRPYSILCFEGSHVDYEPILHIALLQATVALH